MSTILAIAWTVAAVIVFPASPLLSIAFVFFAALNYGPGNQLEDVAEAAEEQGAPPSGWGCGADVVAVVTLIFLALVAMAGLGLLGGV